MCLKGRTDASLGTAKAGPMASAVCIHEWGGGRESRCPSARETGASSFSAES
jgi:hypothetical protein